MATETPTPPVPVPGNAIDRRFHFPPFPPIPDGVQIIPFIDFREWGTRVVGDDKIERDGLGIPTIPLPPKSNKKKGKKKSAAAKPGPRTEWWEDWAASGENLRIRGTYDPNQDRVDRLHQAATDFHQYYQIHVGLQGLWDHFRNFIGVPTSAVFKTSMLAHEDDDMLDADDDSDHEADPAFEMRGPSDVAATDEDPAPPPVENPDSADPKENSKAEIFMGDPVRGIKMFFSSYMRAQGLVWDPRKLVGAPHLVRFFIQYLIRNAVLPEHTEALKRTLGVIDLAALELPRAPAISNALPDAFAVACEMCWGRKADGLMFDDEDDEPEAKRPRLDFGDEIHGAHEHNVSGTEVAFALGEKVAENIAAAVVETDTPSGWGSGGWDAGDWDAEPFSFTPAPLAPLLPPLPTLMALLGPTTLPLTHAPGAVESSLRRITAITPPTNETTTSELTSAAAAVEQGLAARMARVALVPWADWDLDPEVTAPRALRSSAPGSTVPTGAITLLVEPAAAETLCLGMGLRGTWVQLAREEDGEDENDALQDGKEKESYWYLEELVMIIPSFWVV